MGCGTWFVTVSKDEKGICEFVRIYDMFECV